MKNLLILLLLAGGITSCSKDGIEAPQDLISIKKSEILITVTAIQYNNGQCGSGCTGSAEDAVNYVSNASVELFAGNVEDSDKSVSPIKNGKTDASGAVLFEDLEPAQYTVVVRTQNRDKTRVFYTQLNRRSSIEFSF